MFRKTLSKDKIFNEEFLTANRRGSMADRQVSFLRWPLLFRVALQWTILGVVYATAVYAYVQLQIEIPEQTLYGVIGAATLPVIWLLWISWRRIGSISRREIASVAGALTREIRHTAKGKPIPEITVKKQHFTVTPEVYEQFEDEVTYRIYYQPRLKVLLSAEQV